MFQLLSSKKEIKTNRGYTITHELISGTIDTSHLTLNFDFVLLSLKHFS